MLRWTAGVGVVLAVCVLWSHAADEAIIWEPNEAASTQPAPQVSQEAIKKWRDLRFGMMICWNPSSLKGAEIGWSRGGTVPIEEYDNLYKQFDPHNFSADEWVSIAKATGMKYIIYITKHLDGFCMWDTKQTDYNIMNSPLKRDVVKELVQACRKQGLEFGAYYSPPDWYHPDYFRTGHNGQILRPNPNMDRYTEYLKAQSKELLVNYGPLLTLWYDMPQGFDQKRGQGIIDFVRRIQSDILVNNRTGAEGDYETPERRIGGFNMDRPWETCNTLADGWSWRPNDDLASLEECLRSLILVCGGDGNFLLDVGPMADGQIEPRQIERLKEIGAWVAANGQAIYGTRGGPYKPGLYYACTRKDRSLYLFVLRWENDQIVLPPLPAKVISSCVLGGGVADVKQTPEQLTVHLSKQDQKPVATVVRLDVEVEPMTLKPIPAPLTAKAVATNVRENRPENAASCAVDQDMGSSWTVDPQVKTASLEIDFGRQRTFSSVTIHESNVKSVKRVRQFNVEYKSGDSWRELFKGTLVQSKIMRPGRQIVGRFEPVTTQQIRLNVLASDAGFSIGEVYVD